MNQNKRPTQKMVNRIFCFLVVMLIVFFSVDISSLVKLQIINSKQYKLEAEKTQLSDTEIQAQRGTIYDRNGNPLAQSASVWKVYIRPNALRSLENEKVKEGVTEKILNELCPILEIEKEKMQESIDSKYGYVVLKRRVEKDIRDKVNDFISRNAKISYENTNSKGEIVTVDRDTKISSVIGLDPDVKRYYPNQNLASTVLGFVGSDGNGLYGLESYYEKELAGVNGRIVTAKNGKQEKMDSQYESVIDPKPGNNLNLTLDQTIQYYLDTSLEQARADNKAKRAFGIVMDVETGAVLAMSTKQDFNPNTPFEIFDKSIEDKISAIKDTDERSAERKNSQMEQWKNCAVSQPYEPGSVFKLVTAAAAIEENVLPDNMTFTCTGVINVAGTNIHCHKRTGHGTQTFTQGLMNSCNPFFITIGQKLGAETFYKYEEAFGITEKTGIDLPEESKPSAGNTYIGLNKLGPVELASSSFGQSNTLTAIQMATIVNTIANGGKMMQPYVVSSITDSNGNIVSTTQPTVKRQVVSERTADKITEMMELVVSQGTGRNAYVPGYRLAGKTGTSEKQKKSEKGKYVASFACFAPANNPKITILIVIDDPQAGRINGGQIATPVAAEVAEKTLTYMGVDPQYTPEELARLGTNTPSVVGQSVSKARQSLTGYTVKIIGSGDKVVSQSPSGGQKIPQNGVVVLYTDNSAEKSYVEVPNFIGMSASAANQKALEYGLNPRISGTLKGSDLVCYRQSVEKGKKVNTGSVITLYFKTDSGVQEIEVTG